MLRGLWARLTRSRRDEAVRREIDREQGSEFERHRVGESVDDIQADAFVKGHLGGDPDDHLYDDERRSPRST
jgi:hypothetical protein